ncbi:MAG: ABC transporter permease [Candidatus Marinimicrobia bacterium]|nr:ABC transporter permease [Candidatus Neomarinimicrobiota bacterium]MDD4962019.1 ABC transporter permease [Candidatus Neomarinimicrobiota bacterium]MDD5709626.1 ABC transporter permease [Candidatus Neomarinimicrobiota bacterium]MDX9777373.1 ABC transporter permease [bacterium]
MRFYRLAERNMKEIYRDPLTTSLGVLLPLLMLVLFNTIYSRTGLQVFSPLNLAPGVTIFSYTLIVMFASVLLAKDRRNAFLVRLYTTPLRPADFIFAYMLPFLPFALMQTAVCLILGALMGAVYQQLLLSLLVFFLMALSCTGLGVILGALFTENQVSAVGSILIVVVSLFSGAWMELKMVGGIFARIAYLMPFAHAIDSLRAIMNGAVFSDYSSSFFIVLGYTLTFSVLAVLAFRHAMKHP